MLPLPLHCGENTIRTDESKCIFTVFTHENKKTAEYALLQK